MHQKQFTVLLLGITGTSCPARHIETLLAGPYPKINSSRSPTLPNKDKSSYSIQSVDNALDVLEALCTEGDEVRVSHLSKRLGMNKMSLFRYLATFESRGYVEKAKGTGRYRLGLSAYETGQKLLSRMGLLREAKPVIEQLARECNEAIYLVVPRGNEVLLIDMVDTTQQIKITPLLGNRYSITETSAGRVILAHSDEQRKSCADKITEELTTALSLILEQGSDYNRNGFGDGVASLAVPIIDAEGNVPGSLCMIGPEFRLTRKHVEDNLLPKLIDAGVVVSSKLGFVEHLINSRRSYR